MIIIEDKELTVPIIILFKRRGNKSLVCVLSNRTLKKHNALYFTEYFSVFSWNILSEYTPTSWIHFWFHWRWFFSGVSNRLVHMKLTPSAQILLMNIVLEIGPKIYGVGRYQELHNIWRKCK